MRSTIKETYKEVNRIRMETCEVEADLPKAEIYTSFCTMPNARWQILQFFIYDDLATDNKKLSYWNEANVQ